MFCLIDVVWGGSLDFFKGMGREFLKLNFSLWYLRVCYLTCGGKHPFLKSFIKKTFNQEMINPRHSTKTKTNILTKIRLKKKKKYPKVLKILVYYTSNQHHGSIPLICLFKIWGKQI